MHEDGVISGVHLLLIDNPPLAMLFALLNVPVGCAVKLLSSPTLGVDDISSTKRRVDVVRRFETTASGFSLLLDDPCQFVVKFIASPDARSRGRVPSVRLRAQSC